MNKTALFTGITALLVQLWHCISRQRKRQFNLLMGLMMINAIAEVISLGAVLPFLGILVAPERLFSHPIVAEMAKPLGIIAADQLVLPLTIAFGTAALIAGAIRILLLWLSTRTAYATGADLSIELYRRTLYQPYHVHVTLNSSEIISGITNKVNDVVFGVLLPLLTLASSTVLLVAVMLALIAIDPMVASVAAVGFGTSYALITGMSRQRLHRNSQLIAQEQTSVIKALQEGLGGIRDVLLDGTQLLYCDIYRQADNPLRRAQGNNAFISQSPRYIMEALGTVLIAALAYSLSGQNGGIATALPVLGALALGAQRLLPALQQVYYGWANIAGSYATLADTVYFLNQPLPAEQLHTAASPLLIQNTLRLDGVSFRYTSNGPWILDGISLTIPKGSRVGIVGSTGSGKSTMLDLLMGLLIPSEGQLLVDGQSISGNRLRAWQRSVAHVPQNIYLADTTLAENIAFGVPPINIDYGRVRQAARQAQIADFIESTPQGYHAYVGERGIRLSGGQRQRIGIARALYKQASVLVFDEATSALDNATEQSVMNAIDELSNNLTILLVAHRLSTVRRCDMIFELEQGQLIAQGTYEHLLEFSPSFRRMASAI